MKNSVNEIESPVIFGSSEYTWILEKFDEINNKSTKESSVFPSSGGTNKWKLQLYVNSDSQENDKSSLCLILLVDGNINDKVSTKCSFRLQNSRDETFFECKFKSVFNNNTKSWCVKDLITYQEVISSISADCILKIRIVVLAEVFTWEPHHVVSTENVVKLPLLTKLSREFENMFTNSKFSDFIIKCSGGNDIPVSRGILAARSPVFSAMFTHETSENKLGYVEVTDIDEEIMLLLLKFIYTGVCKSLSIKEAEKLLLAADKYELEDLKELCGEALVDGLNASNALAILELAELYHVLEVKTKATEYILSNCQKFADPVIFQKIERKFPNLLTELLTKIFRTSQEIQLNQASASQNPAGQIDMYVRPINAQQHKATVTTASENGNVSVVRRAFMVPHYLSTLATNVVHSETELKTLNEWRRIRKGNKVKQRQKH